MALRVPEQRGAAGQLAVATVLGVVVCDLAVAHHDADVLAVYLLHVAVRVEEQAHALELGCVKKECAMRTCS